jgi:hypothetical protein
MSFLNRAAEDYIFSSDVKLSAVPNVKKDSSIFKIPGIEHPPTQRYISEKY